MNRNQLVGKIVGVFFLVLGLLFLFISAPTINRIVFEGEVGLFPTFHVSSTGYSLSTGQLPIIVQSIILIPMGILLFWKLSRVAAVLGSIGSLLLPLTSLILQLLVSVSGGPSLTELITLEEIIFGVGLFVGAPILGIIYSWRELH
jgi:hypothetical protein